MHTTIWHFNLFQTTDIRDAKSVNIILGQFLAKLGDFFMTHPDTLDPEIVQRVADVSTVGSQLINFKVIYNFLFALLSCFFSNAILLQFYAFN